MSRCESGHETYIHVHVCIDTQIEHTYIHTYIHTYVGCHTKLQQVSACSSSFGDWCLYVAQVSNLLTKCLVSCMDLTLDTMSMSDECLDIQ